MDCARSVDARKQPRSGVAAGSHHAEMVENVLFWLELVGSFSLEMTAEDIAKLDAEQIASVFNGAGMLTAASTK